MSCVCKAGFIYLKDGLDVSSEDGEGSCYQVVHERCSSLQSREVTGKCVDPREYCKEACNDGKSAGDFNEIVGLCICYEAGHEVTECDEYCRRRVSTVVLKGSTATSPALLVFKNNGDINEAATAEFVLDELKVNKLAGSPECSLGQECRVQMQDMTKTKIIGLYGAPASIVTQLQSPTRLTGKSSAYGPKSSEALFGQENPVQCLQVGTTVMWRLDEKSYPVYLKDILLNTNRDFDYGNFR
eukprot:XP_028343330.1 uncharacterized protein LOC114485726 [Physeter catodon]